MKRSLYRGAYGAGTVLSAVLALWCPAAQAAPSSQLVEAKLALESSLERRLGTVLQQVLESHNVFVIVNVELVSETQGSSDDDLLPGVPTKSSPGTQAPLQISSSLVRRLSATVYLDLAASAADATKAKAKAQEMLGVDSRRGDSVSVERISFPKADAPAAPLPFAPSAAAGAAAPAAAGTPAAPPKAVRIPQYIFSALWLIVAALGLWILARIEAPLGLLFRQLIDSLKTLAALPEKRKAEEETAAKAAAEAAQAGPKAAAKAEATSRRLPFSFVEPGDAPTLKLLLRGQKPARAAAVLHFLPPVVASEVLSGLPPQLREEVLGLMRRPTALNPASVARLEDSIRSQLDYLMGGEEKLLAMLDAAPAAARAGILADIERADQALARRLSGRVVMFEDISKLDEAGFKALARQVPIQNLAAAIKSSDALREAVMSRLHGGAAEWLGQEIELSGELPPAVLEARKAQVVEALTKLVRDGKVALRRDEEPAAPASEFETVVELPPEPEETPAPLKNLPGWQPDVPAAPPAAPSPAQPPKPAEPDPLFPWRNVEAQPPAAAPSEGDAPPAFPQIASSAPAEPASPEPAPSAAPAPGESRPAGVETMEPPGQSPLPKPADPAVEPTKASPLFPWRATGEKRKPPVPTKPPPIKFDLKNPKTPGMFPWRTQKPPGQKPPDQPPQEPDKPWKDLPPPAGDKDDKPA